MANEDYYCVKSKCAVCGADVMTSESGCGLCENCGWEQSLNSLDFPNKVTYPNIISYNKAKMLYAQGKPLKPDIEDFVEGFKMYSEAELYYEGKRYGVIYIRDYRVCFYEWNNCDSEQIFDNAEQFMENATINGKLLKDIWNNVYDADYMIPY